MRSFQYAYPSPLKAGGLFMEEPSGKKFEEEAIFPLEAVKLFKQELSSDTTCYQVASPTQEGG